MPAIRHRFELGQTSETLQEVVEPTGADSDQIKLQMRLDLLSVDFRIDSSATAEMLRDPE